MLRSSNGPGGEKDGADSTDSGAAEDPDNLLGGQALQVSSPRFFVSRPLWFITVRFTILYAGRGTIASPPRLFSLVDLCRVPLRAHTSSLFVHLAQDSKNWVCVCSNPSRIVSHNDNTAARLGPTKTPSTHHFIVNERINLRILPWSTIVHACRVRGNATALSSPG